MPSVVDICNLALSHLGDSATVASIDPPEGSAQAEHCARFYPMARDRLLEAHPWGFTIKRVQGANLTSETNAWDYAYAHPADALRVIAVSSADVTDDVNYLPSSNENAVANTPQPYVLEVLADNTPVIYTDLQDAVITYQARIEDSTKYPPMFVLALTWELASMLAGPVIKGKEGRDEAVRCAQMAQSYLTQAVTSDANQRRQPLTHSVPWLAGR